MTIYLDVIWLLNVLIDFMLLKLTAIVLKRTVPRHRMILGTAFASVIVFILFTPASPIVYHPVGKLLYSAIIVWMVFGYRRFSLFIQSFFMFYFVTFIMGGALFAAHYFLQSSQSYDNTLFFSTLGFGDPFGWGLVIIGFPITWYFSKKRFDHVVVRKRRLDGIMPVSIVIDEIIIEVKGLIDTGNHLNDPIHGLPVMFLGKDGAGGKIPEAFFYADPTQVVIDDKIPEEWLKRLSIIPYRGVNSAGQFILALKPDAIYIDHPDGRLLCHKAFVALTEHRLSEERDFDCLLHPDMILDGHVVTPAS